MAKKINEQGRLKEEIAIQKDRVLLYSAQSMAMMMEASKLAVQELMNIMSDGLMTPQSKFEYIQYTLDKVLPNLPDGMVKQDFTKVIEGFLDQIDGDV